MKAPTPTDTTYLQRLRKDYPERCDGKSDAEVAAIYNPNGYSFVECTLWDHLGDAACAYEQLAKAYLKLKSAQIAPGDDRG